MSVTSIRQIQRQPSNFAKIPHPHRNDPCSVPKFSIKSKNYHVTATLLHVLLFQGTTKGNDAWDVYPPFIQGAGVFPSDMEPEAKRPKLEKTVISDDEFDDLEDIVGVKSTDVNYTNSEMFLDTINRKILNFDLPLVCSSTLASTNILICLVCNKFLQGASTTSPAYMHSIDADHHIFLNTKSMKFLILPDQLILSDRRSEDLKDIRLLFNPKFDDEMISKFDKTPFHGKTLTNVTYDVGYVPLTEDVTDQKDSSKQMITKKHNLLYNALSHISPLRDYLIRYDMNDESRPLTNELSKLTKQIWSSNLFKNHISSLAIESFVSTSIPKSMNEVNTFYSWLINTMLKENNKIIKKLFFGKLIMPNKKSTKFSLITIKLPQQSLFKDGTSSSIEQYDLLKLVKEKNLNITEYPKYFTIYIDRKNDFTFEGIQQKLNLNIVKFNTDCLKLADGKEYRLIINITYDDKIHIFDKAREMWFEFDGNKRKEIEKELLFISNCQLQIWENI